MCTITLKFIYLCFTMFQGLSITLNKFTKQLSTHTLPGNPLSCDCNALWLRNWASDEIGPIKDEPRCSYPKSLSGNPLRMLRTSRFTCDISRSSDVISNACSGVPLKSPAQKEVKSGLMSGKLGHCQPNWYILVKRIELIYF